MCARVCVHYACASQAVAINAGDFLAHYNLGCALAQNGDMVLAKDEVCVCVSE